MPLRTPALAAVLLSGALLAGCGGKTAYVTRHPNWNYEAYERIAVTPATVNQREAEADGMRLTDQLTVLLSQNGAFDVLSRSEMNQVFAEQDLAALAEAIDEGTAIPSGQLQIAQALVVPALTAYRLIADRQDQQVPVYRVDRKGRVMLDRRGKPIIEGYQTVSTFIHGAEVEGSVKVIDPATGRILLSHAAQPIRATQKARNRPPRQSPEQLASAAVRELATDFYKTIAPTRIKVKIDEDMLVLATAYFDGRYDTLKEVPRGMESFLLVVRDLPDECQRNEFRVAIAPKDVHRNLMEESFVWSANFGNEGVVFDIPVALLLDAGGEEFVAKLYGGNDPEPILEREFSLGEGKSGGRTGSRGDDDDDEDDD
jgi:hypothetical protein